MLFFAPSGFALEGIVAREMKHLGLTGVEVKNNRVFFEGEGTDLARALIHLRTADRLHLLLAEFPAASFDELFDRLKALDFSPVLRKDSGILVTARCVKSRLMSQTDVQKIGKKAIIESLKAKRGYREFPETGPVCRIDISILNDVATISADACTDGLHKRGYRIKNAPAPLRETTAAALLAVTGYRGKGPFLDPFAGSGTLPIEAALIAANIPPNAGTYFAAQHFPVFEGVDFALLKENALSGAKTPESPVLASDISSEMVDMARFHARRAGVEDFISFSVKPAKEVRAEGERGTVVTNPPYGQRLEEQEAKEALLQTKQSILPLLTKGWRVGVLSGMPDAQKFLGKKGAKVRRLYNGALPCWFYQY